MSQKRVAIVLASLVGTLTLSAAALLMMENNGTSAWSGMPNAIAVERPSAHALVDDNGQLQSDRWNFIIIYESGDLTASAASLADGRVEGVGGATGTRPPASFHFIIGNGQSETGLPDGGIEAESAWASQEVGTPVVGWPNIRTNKDYKYTNAVGVCVIGDLSQRPDNSTQIHPRVSNAQGQSLVQLVNEIRTQCHIPAEGVKFSWELSPNNRNAPTDAQKAFALEVRRQMD